MTPNNALTIAVASLVLAVLGAALLSVSGAAIGLTAPSQFSRQGEASATAARPVTLPQPLGSRTAPDYRAIVAQNKPAVVGITSESTVPVEPPFGAPYGEGPFMWGIPENDPFFQFFRELPVPRGNMRARSLGSGFIISSDGLILTNAHVVRDAKHVTVKLSDRREFKAKVLGSDPVTDIAKGRSLPGDSAVPFIQTDVAVNPGNSGGPLFDSSGAVVGINAQIYSRTGGYEGLSFAIPINVAINAENQILRNGKVEHARLGIQIQSLTPELAASFKRPDTSGALVASVAPDSAAALAGLKPGDIILSYNHQPVVDSGDLSAKVATAAPGDSVNLGIWRDGKVLNLQAELNGASQNAAAHKNGAEFSPSAQGRLGLAARPLTPEEREQAGVSRGLLVQRASGRAAEAGIRPGDIVLAVDGTPIDSDEALRSELSRHQKSMALLIQRGNQRIFIPVQLG